MELVIGAKGLPCLTRPTAVQLDTIALAESCRDANAWLTALSSSANPTYFHCMPLPGQHRGEAAQRREQLSREMRAAHPAVHTGASGQQQHGGVPPIQGLVLAAIQGETGRSGSARKHGNPADLASYSSYGPLALDLTRRSGSNALGSEPRLSERTARRYRVGSDWHERAMRGYGRLVSQLV